eukprot:3053826-Pyramimonas_sp.AAC.1
MEDEGAGKVEGAIDVEDEGRASRARWRRPRASLARLIPLAFGIPLEPRPPTPHGAEARPREHADGLAVLVQGAFVR